MLLTFFAGFCDDMVVVSTTPQMQTVWKRVLVRLCPACCEWPEQQFRLWVGVRIAEKLQAALANANANKKLTGRQKRFCFLFASARSHSVVGVSHKQSCRKISRVRSPCHRVADFPDSPPLKFRRVCTDWEYYSTYVKLRVISYTPYSDKRAAWRYAEISHIEESIKD